MYENRNEPLLSRREFAYRLFLHVLVAMLFIVISIAIGALGHLWFEEDLHWHDAALNAAMIAGGLGSELQPESIGGRIFMAAYGVFMSLTFVAILGVLIAPVVHRILHVLHLDDD